MGARETRTKDRLIEEMNPDWRDLSDDVGLLTSPHPRCHPGEGRGPWLFLTKPEAEPLRPLPARTLVEVVREGKE